MSIIFHTIVPIPYIRSRSWLEIIHCQTDRAPKDLNMSRPTASRIASNAFPSHHIITGSPRLVQPSRSNTILVKIEIQVKTKVPFGQLLIRFSKRI
jgi:hypothetical protein